MMNCASCTTGVNGNFCSHCGRAAQAPRIDWHYVVHEVQHVLHFEKGILYTAKALLSNPGPSIKEFITVERSRLVKPIVFIVMTSLIYTFIYHLFHFEKGYIHYSDAENSVTNTTLIFHWIQSHYGYANIMMGIFIAFWLKLMYRKQDYNFFEILILLCFVMGMGMLILSVFALFEGLTGLHVMSISGAVGVVYCAWAIGHFFDRTRIQSYVKAIFCYVLGMSMFFVAALLLGHVADIVKG